MRPAFINHLLIGILFSLAVCDLRSEESWQDKARRKAEAGDIKAQIELGQSLAGNGKEKDAEAEKWLRRAAEQGDAEAQRALGRFLIAINGRLREKFPNEGITWFEKAVAKGDGESCYFLHMEYKMMFSQSRWDNPNNPYPRGLPSAEESAMFKKSIEWLNKGGEMLNPKCMLALSRLYETGHVFTDGDRHNLFGNTDGIVTISQSTSLGWLQKAADLGNGEALDMLGREYLDGGRLPADCLMALKLFTKAYDFPVKDWYGSTNELVRRIYDARSKAIQGKVDFSNVLPDAKYQAILEAQFKDLEGQLTEWGADGAKDRFEKNREAYESLADAYLSGDPSARNEKRAFEVYMRLCEVCRYDRSIVPKVARIFLDKKPKDMEADRLVKVLEDVVTRTKKEYTFGMLELHAKEGDHAEQKEKERDWMTKQECLLALAKIYGGGIGTKADPVKSNQYYLECLLNEAQQRNLAAARSGDPKAQFRVGYILLDGTEDGAQRTISESAWRGDLFRTPGFIGWSFKHYCENGFLRSELKLDYSEPRQRRNEAVKWITMSAEQGDLQAQAWLADIHSHYADFLNYELAFKWAQKAAVRGNAGALVVLSKLSLEGRGMPKDEIEAYAYMNMAASKDEAFRRYFTELESRLPANVRFMGQQRTKQLQKELEDEDLRRVLSGDKDKVPKKGA